MMTPSFEQQQQQQAAMTSQVLDQLLNAAVQQSQRESGASQSISHQQPTLLAQPLRGKEDPLLYQSTLPTDSSSSSPPNAFEPVTKKPKTDSGAGRDWTTDEDCTLRKMVAAHGHEWSIVSTFFHQRSPQECAHRWKTVVGKKVKGRWNKAEDQALLRSYQEYVIEFGEFKKSTMTAWAKIAEKIPGRSGPSCMVRYNESLDPTLRFVFLFYE
jgi:hypothetical protein